MSLQTYDINLALNATQDIGAQGRYIYYLKGTTANITAGVAAAAGNQAIKVQPGNTGATIILVPGQSYRLPDEDKAPSSWKLSNLQNAEAITGTVMIGEGDFRDSNTSNTNFLKLDASFANNVTVTNAGAAQAVPVSSPNPLTVQASGGVMPVSIQNAQVEITNDSGNRIPVTLDPAQTFNISSNIMAYTNSYASSASSVANTAIPLLAAATNVNGAILNKFELVANPGTGMSYAVIAKATAPANLTDGDILFSNYIPNGTNRTAMDISKDGQPRVVAGKGIWYISDAPDTVKVRNALMTVL